MDMVPVRPRPAPMTSISRERSVGFTTFPLLTLSAIDAILGNDDLKKVVVNRPGKEYVHDITKPYVQFGRSHVVVSTSADGQQMAQVEIYAAGDGSGHLAIVE